MTHLPISIKANPQEAPNYNHQGTEYKEAKLKSAVIVKKGTADGKKPTVDLVFEVKDKDANLNAAAPEMLEALKRVRKYLIDRGIQHKGTEGRTEVLPKIEQAIANASKDDQPTESLAVAMTTGTILQMLAGAIKGAEQS